MRRLSFILLLLAAFAFAQSRPATPPAAPQQFRLLVAKVRGTKVYSESEVLAGAGLKLGDTVTQDQLQQASNRLGNSGVFSTVSYTFAGVPGGVNVTFDVRDNPQLVPVTFQNLVWLTRDELLAGLHERLPLFRDQVPLAGEMDEQVRATLEQVLAAHGIDTKIASAPQYPRGMAGGVPAGMGYFLDGVDVRIGEIELAGRSALEQAVLDAALADRKKDSFLQPVSSVACVNDIKKAYLARGYLAIAVEPPQVTLTDPSPAAPVVKLTFPIQEGRQYRLSGIGWQGNTAYGAADLEKTLDVKPGAPANLPRLEQELNKTRRLYGVRGYLSAAFTPSPELHDDGTANIIVAVNEGPQYRMGTLIIKGLAPELEQRVRQVWKIPTGAIYDQSYPDRFVNDTIGILPPGIRFGFMSTERIDDQLKTADITIEYKRR